MTDEVKEVKDKPTELMPEMGTVDTAVEKGIVTVPDKSGEDIWIPPEDRASSSVEDIFKPASTGYSTSEEEILAKGGEVEVKIREYELVDIDKLHPNTWNPNEQTDATFNQLVEKIRKEGFKVPVTAVPWSDFGEGHGKILYGEHRWKVGKILGMKKIPVYWEHHWDEVEQKMATVRDNIISGHLNDVKFTDLVNSLKEKFHADPDELARNFGFDTEQEFLKHYIEEKEKREKTFVDSLMDDAKKEKHATEGLTDILINIFDSGRATLDQNYMFFVYKGKMQTVVFVDTETMKGITAMGEHLKTTGKDANIFIREAITKQLGSELTA